jgi:transposase InsO family protein
LKADNGATCSTSRGWERLGNAVMESFFSSLKTERIARKLRHAQSGKARDVRFYRVLLRSGLLALDLKASQRHGLQEAD